MTAAQALPDEPDFTEEELQFMLDNIDKYSDVEIAEIYKLVNELERRKQIQTVRDDLISFCQHMDHEYIVGHHHRILADMLMSIERGTKDRICVNIPPRHGKSMLDSTYFPAWYLGRNPTKKVMLVSHTTDLAVDFGRKVRNLINTEQYREIFPNVRLAIDSKSAGRWNTNHKGEFYAAGVGSALAGRGADLLLLDDPHSEQDVLNGNFEVFARAYDWFRFGARTRLMPGGSVAIIQCMTGDTAVLRPDGTETPLQDIRPGDEIATWDKGELTSSKVLNHQSNGIDKVYKIRTICGNLLRSNERHPFLVQRPNGETEWVRLKNLKPGDLLVSLKDVSVKAEPKQNQACVVPVAQKLATIVKTLLRRITQWGITGSTRVKHAANLAATNRLSLVGFATITTHLGNGPRGIVQRPTQRGPSHVSKLNSNTDMGLSFLNTYASWMNKMANVLSVKFPQKSQVAPTIGAGCYVLTTVTEPSGYEGFCATTATSLLNEETQSKYYNVQSNISKDFTTQQIKSITFDGYAEVFDLQIEGTENFIASKIVSHNTRWHLDDLTGRVIRDMAKDEDADQYEVVEFPAILEIEGKDGEKIEKALWPEFFDLAALKRTKASMPLFQWNAQFQQNPTAEEAAVIKREWWGLWEKDDPPECEYVIITLDTAAETHNRADFTAITTWGVFMNTEVQEYHIILLDSIKDRYEFPELKQKAMEVYKETEPDAFIVEKKSSGTALYQEMRRMGIPVQEYTPHRGSGDKLARLNSVADIVSSGMVWVPDTRWAEELVEEIAAFPFGSNDDLVDATIMAMMRFRQGGFIRLPNDMEDEIEWFKGHRKTAYY